MPFTLIPPKIQFFDSNGSPLASGKLYTYNAGTQDEKTTYTDSALSIENTNPIILNARGEAIIYLTDGESYKFKLTDGDDPENEIWTQDNILSPEELTQASIGGALYPRTAAEITAAVTPSDYSFTSDQANWINVKRYGAVGDGTTDDSTAIQNAIDVAREKHGDNSLDSDGLTGKGVTLYFPGGQYLHNTTLDFTNIRFKGFNIVMDGQLYSQTSGTPGADFTRSRWIVAYGFKMKGHATNSPNVGVLQARNSTNQASGNFRWYDTWISGEFTVAAHYSYASEGNIFFGYFAENSNDDTVSDSRHVLYVCSTNINSITSAFETIATGIQSCNENYFHSAYIYVNDVGVGKPIRLDGVKDFFIQGYAAYGGGVGAVTRECIVWYTTETTTNVSGDIHLDLHCEAPSATLNSILELERTTNTINPRGVFVRDYNAQTESYIRFSGSAGTVTGLEIVGPLSATQVAFTNDGTAGWFLEGGIIRNLNASGVAGVIDFSILSRVTGTSVWTADPGDITANSGVANQSWTAHTTDRIIHYQGRQTATIASGVFAFSKNWVDVRPESGTTDDLDGISGTFFEGERITLLNSVAANTITVKHNTGGGETPFLNRSDADISMVAGDCLEYRYSAQESAFLEVGAS